MTTKPLDTSATTPRPPRRALRLPVGRAALWVFVGIACFLSVVPFYLMFVWASLPSDQIFAVPPHLWFGTAIVDNFNKMMDATFGMALRQFWNSLYISLLSTVTTLFFCSLALSLIHI